MNLMIFTIKIIKNNNKIKNNPQSTNQQYNLMMLFKDSNKIQKNKSLSKLNKFKIICLNKQMKIKKTLLKNSLKNTYYNIRSTAIKRLGNNCNH